MVFVGVQHLSGTSKKTGDPYNFYQLHAISRSPRMEKGFSVQTFNVSPQVWDQFPLEVGQQFRATTDGFIIPLDSKLDIHDLASVLNLLL